MHISSGIFADITNVRFSVASELRQLGFALSETEFHNHCNDVCRGVRNLSTDSLLIKKDWLKAIDPTLIDISKMRSPRDLAYEHAGLTPPTMSHEEGFKCAFIPRDFSSLVEIKSKNILWRLAVTELRS